MQPRLVFSQLQRGDLLPEGEVLEDQFVSGLACRSKQADQQNEKEDEGVPHRGGRVVPTGGDRNHQRTARLTSRSPASCVGSRAKYLIFEADGIMTSHKR